MVFTQFVFLIRVQVSSTRSVLAGQFHLQFVSVCFPFLPGTLHQIPWLVDSTFSLHRLRNPSNVIVPSLVFPVCAQYVLGVHTQPSLLPRHSSAVPQPYQSHSYVCVFFCCNRCLAAMSYLLFQIQYFLSVYSIIEAILLQDLMHLFSLITQFSLARMSYQNILITVFLILCSLSCHGDFP